VHLAITKEKEEWIIPPGLAELAQEILKEEGFEGEWEISLTFVENSTIQELNKTYRGLDELTDVLSFSQIEGEQFPSTPGAQLLGDIVIAYPIAEQQALEEGWSIEMEIVWLFIHSLLHLLGYTHSQHREKDEMFLKEESYFKLYQKLVRG